MNDFNQRLSLTEAGTTYSNAFQIDDSIGHVEAVAACIALSGGNNAVITLQHSDDKSTWTDVKTIGTLSALANASSAANRIKNYVRFKVVLSGGTMTLTLFAQGKEGFVDEAEYAEDAPHQSGDKGKFFLAVRMDTPASTAGQNGDYAAVINDQNGCLYIREYYQPGYEDNNVGVAKVEHRYGYTNITTATTTVVKSGPGFLHAITVNTTSAGAITAYDNTAGSGAKIATLKASVAEQTYLYDVSFTNGLTIVTAGASDITVSSR